MCCLNATFSGDGDSCQGGGGVEKDPTSRSAGEVDDIFDPPLASTPMQQSREGRDGAGATASTTAAQQGQGDGSNLAGGFAVII